MMKNNTFLPSISSIVSIASIPSIVSIASVASIVSILSLSSIASQASAQEASYRYFDATQLWRLTNNAAGLGLDSAQNRGYALFNAEHWNGDYTRVQEGTQQNQLRFETERYQTVGKYLHAYGHFDFDYGRTKNRAWADVMRPYNANPFISGSSISGKYDSQDFNFTAALGTVELNGWRYGLRLDYNVGDLSRLRDPRSRSQLLDYKLSPAVTYSFGQQTVGLSGFYHRRKEKITGVTTVQQNATMKYYLMSGLEHAEGTVGGYSSFSREWVDHRFGAELSYAEKTSARHSLLALSISRGEEYAYGQYKYEPGRYVHYQYGAKTLDRFYMGNTIHQLDLQVDYEQAYADEYRQELLQEKDAQTGYTSYSYRTQIVYKKRYQMNQLHADLRYRIHFTQQQEEQAYAGIHAALNSAKNKHLLPASEMSHGGMQLMAEGGMSLGSGFWVDAAAGGFFAKTPNLSLADATTDYATGVLLPDMNYYEANYWHGRLQLTYEFPLTIKGETSRWFVRAYGDYLRTNNSLDAKMLGLSVGLFN